MKRTAITYREDGTDADIAHIREIAESSGFFYPEEVAVATELIEER